MVLIRLFQSLPSLPINLTKTSFILFGINNQLNISPLLISFRKKPFCVKIQNHKNPSPHFQTTGSLVGYYDISEQQGERRK